MSPFEKTQALCGRLKEGNSEASGEAFQACERRWLRVARSKLGNTADAEDAVQELIYRLWRFRERIDTDAAFFGLCETALRNICIDILRKRREVCVIELPDVGVSPPQSSSSRETEIDVWRFIRSVLSNKEEAVLDLYLQGLKQIDIAARLNRSSPWVCTTLANIRTKARQGVECEERRPERLRGMLLDDDPRDLADLAHRLRQLHAKINPFSCGDSAACAAEKALQSGRPYDFFVFDNWLYDVEDGGYQIARNIRNMVGYDKSPVMLVTAHPDLPGLRKRCRAHRLDLLPKGGLQYQLLPRLQHLLAEPDAADATSA